jgi:hypothetical protein
MKNSLQELSRLRGTVHTTREVRIYFKLLLTLQHENNDKKRDISLTKSVNALKIHDQSRNIMATVEKRV